MVPSPSLVWPGRWPSSKAAWFVPHCNHRIVLYSLTYPGGAGEGGLHCARPTRVVSDHALRELRDNPNGAPVPVLPHLRLPSIGSGRTVLHCAHRTSTALPCAFCEQEGWSGCSLFDHSSISVHFSRWWPAWSSTARVQRGPSQAARCASTGDQRATLLSPACSFLPSQVIKHSSHTSAGCG